MDRKVGELSVVEQQVVEIVKALSFTASVLIMDEPSAALTDKELTRLFEIIRTLKARGVTVIYISHMLEEIFQIADRVTVLKDGKVMGTRPAGELTKDELIRLMVGRQIEDYFPAAGRPAGGRPLLEVRGLGKRGRLSDISFRAARRRDPGRGRDGGLRAQPAGPLPAGAGAVSTRGRDPAARPPVRAAQLSRRHGRRASATSPTTARPWASWARCPSRRT